MVKIDRDIRRALNKADNTFATSAAIVGAIVGALVGLGTYAIGKYAVKQGNLETITAYSAVSSEAKTE